MPLAFAEMNTFEQCQKLRCSAQTNVQDDLQLLPTNNNLKGSNKIQGCLMMRRFWDTKLVAVIVFRVHVIEYK